MASRKLAGDLSMKNSKWMVGVLVVLSFLTSCSKSKGPSPEDTSLIKGTDRGTFIGSAEDFAERNGDDLSPIGASISGLDGEDGLLPQDPFWSNSDNLANGDRPFDPIFFGFDQYSIGPEERTKLQDIASFLASSPNVRILVEGYCDWKGTPAYNKSLGDRRASSVKDYLIDLGVDSSRVEIISMGDEIATPDADPTTAGLERKAQFLVLKDS
jgi:peptidoglycan-associated lipoprotein